MKKMMFVLSFAALVFTILGCSNGNANDFRDFSWGTKIDKVISTEKKNGNATYEEDNFYEHEKSITYSNLIVLDKKADATYVFIDLLDNTSRQDLMNESNTLLKELENPETTESRKEEIYKLMDQRIEEMKTAASSYPLDDFLLRQAFYHFDTLSSQESDEILAELTQKYGEPKIETFANSLIYLWENDRSNIEYDTGRSRIMYSAKYSIMEQFADVDKYNKKSNSKESNDEL